MPSGLCTFLLLIHPFLKNSGRATALPTPPLLWAQGWIARAPELGWELFLLGGGRRRRVTKTSPLAAVTCLRPATVSRTPQTQKACWTSHATAQPRFQHCPVTTGISSSTPATTSQDLLSPLRTTGVESDTAPAEPKSRRGKERTGDRRRLRLPPRLQLPARPQHLPLLPGRLSGSWMQKDGLCGRSAASTAACFSWTTSCLPSTWAATVSVSLSSATSAVIAARTDTNFLHTSSAESTLLTKAKSRPTFRHTELLFPLPLRRGPGSVCNSLKRVADSKEPTLNVLDQSTKSY